MAGSRLDSLSDESLQLLAEELRQQLEDLAIYRDYLTVKQILAERQGGPRDVAPYKPRPIRLGRITAIGAATEALKEANRPLNINELVEALPRHGFTFKTGSRKPPASALAAYLAKPGPNAPIVSIWLNNRPMWWFRGEAVPGAEVA